MLKIASVSGDPLQKGSRRASCFQQSQLRAFGTRSLTYSHVLISTQASRSQVFPPRLPLLNSVELTNYGYFCILCTNPIYVFGPSVISWILLLIKISFIYYFFDLMAKYMRLTYAKIYSIFGIKCKKSRRLLGLRPRPRWGSLRRSPDPLVAMGFLLSAITPSALTVWPTRTFSYIRTPASRSQLFPLQAPLAQFCGADELSILLYTLYSPNLCFRALCYFMDPPSNKNFIHLLFFRFDS